ncbi:unnamed protein product [Lathyrus sativus]|nr:unnamed protein product [Lathyrus sativus]
MDSNNWTPNQGSADWRTQLDPESRQRIVHKIMDTLKKRLPVSGTEGLHELRKIAQRFEDKIYTSATSKSDYLRKISIKMLTLETKSQSTIACNMTSNEGGPSNNPPDQGLVLQSQVLNLGQQHSNPHQQLLPQTIQNHVAPQPNLPSVSTLSQTPSQNISLCSNIQQTGQSSASNSIGQNFNIQGMFPGYQRQIPGRQQVLPPQQQQQNLLQPNQLNTSQQPLMQTSSAPNQLNTSQKPLMQTSSAMQPSTMQSFLSSLQQNQQSNNVQQSTQSRHQQHSQIIRQQQQQLQNSIAQQQQTAMLQQLLINQQNNLTNIHQLSGNNVSGLQQQKFGTDSGNQGIQTNHHSAHMLQQPKFSMQPQLQHNASKLLPSQSQQSQPQASLQQLMSQIHSQLAQMQQQMGLQQQPSSSQRDMQQKLQASGAFHQQQSVLDQQKQLYQSQRALPETSTTSVDSTTQTEQLSEGDWQEELYQKLQTMKEDYLPDLNEIFQEIVMRLQQYDSTPQQPKSDHIEKLRVYRLILERVILFLQLPKNSIRLSFKEKLGACEKHIVNLINSFRPRKGISSLQPGQLLPTHTSFMPQSQSQVTSVQSHENLMISQMQPSNLQGSAASLQHNSMFGLSTTQQNMLNTIQPSNNVDAGQGNSMNSLQKIPLISLQQNSVIRTHGTSTSLLLAEFSGLDDAYFNAFTTTFGKDFGKEFGKELLKETRSKKIEKLKKEVESVTMKMMLLILVLICFWFSFVLFYKSL